jgi:hypothetical protein
VHGAQDGLNVAVRKVLQGAEGGRRGNKLFAGQGPANQIDELGWQVGDVAEGLVADLGAEAEGAAQEVGLIELAFVVAGCSAHMNRAIS